MSVYGGFITAFPEIMKTFDVWTKPDESDKRQIRGIYVPAQGSRIDRKRLSGRGTWGQDISNTDLLYVHKKYRDKISIGDYTRYKKSMLRIMGDLPYDDAADYIIFNVERIQGADPSQNQPLEVNKAVFR